MEDATCPICLDVVPTCETPCGHWFCKACLKTWLTLNPQCPVCRQPVGSVVKPLGSFALCLQIHDVRFDPRFTRSVRWPALLARPFGLAWWLTIERDELAVWLGRKRLLKRRCNDVARMATVDGRTQLHVRRGAHLVTVQWREAPSVATHVRTWFLAAAAAALHEQP